MFLSGFGILGLDPVEANGGTILQFLDAGGGHCFGLTKTLTELLLVFGGVAVTVFVRVTIGTNHHRVWPIIPLISPGIVVVPIH